jgi:uncharacterized LabA/DUF88 family protein
MRKTENNYAFIDGQNIYKGIKDLEWTLDWKKFRVYLKEKYNIAVAYIFLGFIPENQKLYQYLKQDGFILRFRPVTYGKGIIKGNVDANLILQAMIDLKNYDGAVIVSSDGDFYPLVEHLIKKGKLKRILCPSHKKCSSLLKKLAHDKIDSLETLNKLLSEKRIGPPHF